MTSNRVRKINTRVELRATMTLRWEMNRIVLDSKMIWMTQINRGLTTRAMEIYHQQEIRIRSGDLQIIGTVKMKLRCKMFKSTRTRIISKLRKLRRIFLKKPRISS